jgi:hypothetical protein
MTLTPSVRAISLCSFPCLAKSFACASFVATSTLEYRFNLAIAACPQPPRASVLQHKGQLLFFGQADGYDPEKRVPRSTRVNEYTVATLAS